MFCYLPWGMQCATAECVAWVSREEWHPSQSTNWVADGRLEMKLPYTNQTELVMDILRHCGNVSVAKPEALKAAVLQQLQAGLQAA